jgi:hypothetical protein
MQFFERKSVLYAVLKAKILLYAVFESKNFVICSFMKAKILLYAVL